MTDEITETTSRWERRKERTHRRLLEVAERLFQAKGFDETTVEEIAVAADVAKGTFFNYFESKESLLGDLLNRRMRAIFDAPPDTDAPATERIRRLLHAMWQALEPYRHLSHRMFVYAMTRAVTRPRPTTPPKERPTAARALTNLIEEGQTGGIFRRDFDAELAGGLLATYFFRLCFMECFEDACTASCIEDRIQEALDLLYAGMLAEK